MLGQIHLIRILVLIICIIQNIFGDQYLGSIGRMKLNKKIFNKNWWRNSVLFQPADLLGGLYYLFKVDTNCDSTHILFILYFKMFY